MLPNPAVDQQSMQRCRLIEDSTCDSGLHLFRGAGVTQRFGWTGPTVGIIPPKGEGYTFDREGNVSRKLQIFRNPTVESLSMLKLLAYVARMASAFVRSSGEAPGLWNRHYEYGIGNYRIECRHSRL